MTAQKEVCYIILTKTQDKEVAILFKQNMLKAKIVEKGISVIQLCSAIGICETTYYRKLSRDGDFTRFEILGISNLLGLSAKERDSIFFGEKLA